MVLWGHNQLNVPSKMIIATTSMMILMFLGVLSCEEPMLILIRLTMMINDDDDDDDCGAFGPHCVISRLMFVGAVGCSMLIV